MTFSAARCALGAVPRRDLRSGLAIPTIVGVTTGNVFGDQVVTPTAGSIGDLIFIHLTRRNKGGSPEFNQIAGETCTELWNVTTTGISSSGHAGYWRIRTGSDTTYTFDEPGEDWAGWICYTISGHDPTTPIIDFAIKSGTTSSATWTVPAVLGDITNCLLLQEGGSGGGIGSIIGPGFGGYTEDHASHRFGGASGAVHMGVHEDLASGGGSGTRVWNSNSTQETKFAAQLMIAPIESEPFYLEQEGSSDHILFEDSSGVLILE